MIIHQESHIDHVSREILDWVLDKFRDRDAFFIEAVEISAELPTLQCGLHGPIMGDAPVPEEEVTYEVRAGRRWHSRSVNRPTRATRQIVVIGGPYQEHSCILYTVFAGPLSPKEPDDPTLSPENQEESRKFWSEHALTFSS